jgi:hypothetical protein
MSCDGGRLLLEALKDLGLPYGWPFEGGIASEAFREWARSSVALPSESWHLCTDQQPNRAAAELLARWILSIQRCLPGERYNWSTLECDCLPGRVCIVADRGWCNHLQPIYLYTLLSLLTLGLVVLSLCLCRARRPKGQQKRRLL